MKKMYDLILLLKYKFKIKIRETNNMLKNYFVILVALFIVSSYLFFYFGKVIILNLETIRFYSNYIFAAISIITVLFILLKKRIPLEWHPANIIYLSKSKFQIIIKFSLFKKLISYVSLAVTLTAILKNIALDFQTIQMFLSLLNLFVISLTSRYMIYNKKFNLKILSVVFSYIAVLNFQLYLKKYLATAVIIFLIYISILEIKKVMYIQFNVEKTFNDMIFINRIEAIARGRDIQNMQEINRETLAEKNRTNIIIKNLKFKNPIYNKNLITFSRLNVTITIYLFVLLLIAIVLYKLEIFEFVKEIKKLGLGLFIIALFLCSFIKNIITLIVDQKNLLLDKSEEGLYLPYKKTKIINSFILLGTPILLFLALFIGLIFQQSIWIIIVSLFFYLLSLLISLNYTIKTNLVVFEYVIFLIIFGISYLLIQ